MKGDIPADATEMQRVIRHYCQQLEASKLGNLGEMGKFLETPNLPSKTEL